MWSAAVLSLVAAVIAVLPARALGLTSSNDTPFVRSDVIAGAFWTSIRHGPPRNQSGDILATSWADDGNLYVLMDDGGVGPVGGAFWRNAFARIKGLPPELSFAPVGVSGPPATWGQIFGDPQLWTGPLGPYYSTGFASVNHVFYATQVDNWDWTNNAPFQGLAGIAYSTDRGRQWRFPARPFSAPVGNLTWVQSGRDAPAPDGYVYAIATEREFNASALLLGRTRPDIADMTDPSRWRWASVWLHSKRGLRPGWSSSIGGARPIVNWVDHITYPRMSYDAGLHRYLLTFTFSYGATPPAIWKDGSELVILDGPHPWGPFSFVAREPYFGPTNGYDPAFPIKWISPSGLDLWLIYAANCVGCGPELRCDARCGFNYRRLRLRLTSRRDANGGASVRPRMGARMPPRPANAALLAPRNRPRHELPRLYLSFAHTESAR